MSRKFLGVNHIAVLFAMMFVAACASNNSASTGGSDIVPGSAADLEQNIGNRVYFALDSSTLDSAARAQLQNRRSGCSNGHPPRSASKAIATSAERVNTTWLWAIAVPTPCVIIWSAKASTVDVSKRSPSAKTHQRAGNQRKAAGLKTGTARPRSRAVLLDPNGIGKSFVNG